VSTEWIVLVWSIKYVVNITKAFTYSRSDRQLDNIFDDDRMVPHEYVYIRKINLQRPLVITEIKRRELPNYTKEL